MSSNRAHELRQWAFGDNSRSAAIELLLRTGLAEDAHPWIIHQRAWDTWAIDFDTLTEHADGLAGEHRAGSLAPSRLVVLRIAAALSDDTPLRLRTHLPALEYEHTELVMIAIAHSAGYTQFTATTGTPADLPLRPPLASWPE